jgi:hypothetical protein
MRGGGAQLLQLFPDSREIPQALPPADGGAFLVERIWPHGPASFLVFLVLSSLTSVWMGVGGG